jgi:hypothetical protein
MKRCFRSSEVPVVTELRVSNDYSNNNIHRHTSAVEAGASKVAGPQTTQILSRYVLSMLRQCCRCHGWQFGMPKNEGKCFYFNRNTVGGAPFIIIRKMSASFSFPDLLALNLDSQ